MARRRLIGWAAIARYLGVAERTARRWEHHDRLPLPVGLNADDPTTVAAYIDELDAWREARVNVPRRGRPLRLRRLIVRDAK